MNRPLQYFSDEYLEHCRKLTPDEVVRFLDDYSKIVASSEKSESQLISIKIPKNLLNVFKLKAQQDGKPYQSQIKQLMRNYVANG